MFLLSLIKSPPSLFGLWLLIFLMSGCSFTTSTENSGTESYKDPTAVSLFLLHPVAATAKNPLSSSMASSEFEQYKISSFGVYAECGIFRNKQKISHLQQFVPVESSDWETISGDVKNLLNEEGSLFESTAIEKAPQTPAEKLPQFELSVSFDGTSASKKGMLEPVVNAESLLPLKNVFELIRASSQNQCGTGYFFGLKGHEN